MSFNTTAPLMRIEKAREILFREANAVLEIAESLALGQRPAFGQGGESGPSRELGQAFSGAVALLLDCRGCVILSGIGKAGLVAQKLVATLASTGTPSHFLHPAEAVHGDLGRVTSRDIVILFSQSGETEEIVRLLPPLTDLGIPVIAVTASADCTLARHATLVLPFGARAEADPLNLAPSTSTTAMLALGDALALVVSDERGFRAEHFAKFHPGGSLGRKLSRVEDAMRPIGECRVAPDSETVRGIFLRHRVPGRRSGAVLLHDAEGRLSGIFTDSDLVRLFEARNDGGLDRPVAEVMTRMPLVVTLGSNMLEAVAIMARRKISELPVIDEHSVPVGMIDITDVVAHFPEYALFAENPPESVSPIPRLRIVA